MNAKVAPHALSDPNQMRIKWIEFLKQWKFAKFPHLYFVRVDVQNAYPSVNLHKLEELIDLFPVSDDEGLVLKKYHSVGSAKSLRLEALVSPKNTIKSIKSSILIRPLLIKDTGMVGHTFFQLTYNLVQLN